MLQELAEAIRWLLHKTAQLLRVAPDEVFTRKEMLHEETKLTHQAYSD